MAGLSQKVSRLELQMQLQNGVANLKVAVHQAKYRIVNKQRRKIASPIYDLNVNLRVSFASMHSLCVRLLP